MGCGHVCLWAPAGELLRLRSDKPGAEELWSLTMAGVGGWEVKGLDPSALDGFYGYGAWRRVGIASS